MLIIKIEFFIAIHEFEMVKLAWLNYRYRDVFCVLLKLDRTFITVDIFCYISPFYLDNMGKDCEKSRFYVSKQKATINEDK